MTGIFSRVKKVFLTLFSSKPNRLLKFILPLIFLGVVFALPAQADPLSNPDIGDKVLGILAHIVITMAQSVGSWVVTIIGIIVSLLKYNSFSTSPAVGMGWAVIRDVVNMFFVLILIAIAFGTILGGLERFKWRQQVPRLLLVAIFINFSRLFCGLMIDFSQVIMMTFVNAIKDIAGGNFIQMLGLQKIMEASATSILTTDVSTSGGIKAFDLFAAAMLALLLMLIVFVTLIFLTLILAFRIVTLWVLVTIAPLAWFFKSTENIVKLKGDPYKNWWAQFMCCLQLGPILVFFLWLALAVAGSGTLGDTFTDPNSEEIKNFALLKMMAPSQLVGFIVSIALLFAGFKAASDACETGGLTGVMKSLAGGAEKVSKGLVAAPVIATKWGGKKAWGGWSGEGGIKGATLGSKGLSQFTQFLARSPLRFAGAGLLANVVNKQRIATTSKKAKYDQDRSSTIAKAGDYDKKSKKELSIIAGSSDSDKYTKMAAVNALSAKSHYKDDPDLTHDEREKLIKDTNIAREVLKDNPEALEAFEKRIIKQSPSLATDTIFSEADTSPGNVNGRKINAEKLREYIDDDKIGAGDVLSGMNSENASAIMKAFRKKKDPLTGKLVDGDEVDGINFLNGVFGGDEKNWSAAVNRIKDAEHRKAFVGDISDPIKQAKLVGFAQKDKINPITGAIEKDVMGNNIKVADHDTMNTIISVALKAGGDVGNMSNLYADIGIADRAGVSATPVQLAAKVKAQKAMAKQVGQNASPLSDNLAKMDPATGVVQARLDNIMANEEMEGETIEVIRKKRKLKLGVDIAENIFINTKVTNPNLTSGSAADKTEAEDQLRDALKEAIKSGAKIDFHALISAGGNVEAVTKSAISSSKIEDLLKIGMAQASQNDVGRVLWTLPIAVLKRFCESNNIDAINALRATNGAAVPIDKKKALQGIL